VAGSGEVTVARLRRIVQGPDLDEIKRRERPVFTPVPDQAPKDAAYVVVRRARRVKRWAGYLVREGFRWSRGTWQWVYDQHDDGTFVTATEADWIADRVREMVAGELSLTVGYGLFVEPAPLEPPVHRPYLRPRHP
jgi:hypothetical protein